MQEPTTIYLKIKCKECGTIFKRVLPNKEVWEKMKKHDSNNLVVCGNCYCLDKINTLSSDSNMFKLIYATSEVNFEPPKEKKGV